MWLWGYIWKRTVEKSRMQPMWLCMLRRHVITHNGEKSNKSNKCDFISSRADKLRTYLKTHSGVKLNKCKQCKYASSRTDMLRTHLKTHIGEKLNKCNQSNYASSRTDMLRRHFKEKLNKCNQCDFASSQSGHFRTHLKMHSGKAKQMQPMWLCVLRPKCFEITFKNTKTYNNERKWTSAINVTMLNLVQTSLGDI